MFDKLNNVKSNWSNGKPVIIQKNKQHVLAIPCISLNESIFGEIWEKMEKEMQILLPFQIFKELELPSLKILGDSISPRFPIATQLFRNAKSKFLDNQSLKIGPRKIESETDYNDKLYNFCLEIGTIIDDRINNNIDREKLLMKFYNLSETPGIFTVTRPVFKSLLRQNSIFELVYDLSKIAKFEGAILVKPLNNLKNELKYEIMDAQTIFNLWRSINKIQKNRIGYEI
tara:strand:+ start:2115 stop:2801 length:687 start_codon:yes stop_codon:yes gene_type:complete